MDQQEGRAELSELVQSYLRWCAPAGYAAETIRGRRRNLLLFVRWCRRRGIVQVRDVDGELLERYRGWVARRRKTDGTPLSSSSRRGMLIALRCFFSWSALRALLLLDPARELRLPRREPRPLPPTFSIQQIHRLLSVPDLSRPIGLRDRAMLEVLYGSGLRRSELVGLDVGDVEWGRALLRVRRGKGRRERRAVLGSRAGLWLRRYLRSARPKLAKGRALDALFVSQRGTRLSGGQLSARVSASIRQAGLGQRGSCHLLRHTAATLMLQGGADIRLIQVFLGHQTLSTTQHYTRVTVAELRRVHRASHPGERRWLEASSSPDNPA